LGEKMPGAGIAEATDGFDIHRADDFHPEAMRTG